MSCALCNHHLDTLVSNTDAKSGEPLEVYICGSCGLVQQHPLPSEEDLQRYYATDYRLDYKKTTRPKPKHIHRSIMSALDRLEFLERRSGARGKLLDIGAGSGEFVALARRHGYDASGIEPNHGYSQHARSEYLAPVQTAGLYEVDGAYDTITMFHVLEHLRSPVEVFQRLRSLLKPGGKLFIEVPWALSESISPDNRYFRAHLFYYDLETLAACASPSFRVVSWCVGNNLRVLLEPVAVEGVRNLPSAAYIQSARRRLSGHGWFRYLTVGKAYLKPARRIRRLWQEFMVSGLSGRQLFEAASRPMTIASPLPSMPTGANAAPLP